MPPRSRRAPRLDPATRDRIAQQLSAFTGLSVSYILAANLRVDLGRFEKELLRDQRLTTGRYDSRYTGIDADAAGERPEYDASDTAIGGAFIASFQDYVQRELHYKTDMPYRVSAYGLDGFDWDFKHKAPGNGRGAQTSPDVAIDLSAAMRTNPYLHLLSLNGYYDMATPFFGTEYDIKHMGLDPAQAQNVEFRYYPSGHMAYLNPDALHMLHRDLAAFYDETVGAARETGRTARQAGAERRRGRRRAELSGSTFRRSLKNPPPPGGGGPSEGWWRGRTAVSAWRARRRPPPPSPSAPPPPGGGGFSNAVAP